MPKFDNKDDLTNYNSSGFSFSATRLERLSAMEYTLVSIICDISGSVASYAPELEKVIRAVVDSCQRSPRKDNLMLRLTAFNSSVTELHGFKLLTNCAVADYTNILKCDGMTALFDATYNAVKAQNDYAETLVNNDFSINGIVFVITDGMDNRSKVTLKMIKDEFARSTKKEVLESMVSVLIGVDAEAGVKQYLTTLKDDAGFTQYVSMGEANEKKLAKLAEFVSHSISSQSSSLGTGGPSKPISATF